VKIAIIGSGMSGLTAGAYLARGGHQVTVYEQFATIGGVTATVSQDGFRWDIGPLLLDGFAPGDRGRLILDELGISEKVETVHEDRGLEIQGIPLWKPVEYGGPRWRKEKLKEIFPEERDTLDRYYQFYDRVIHLFSLVKQSEEARGLKSLLLKLQLWLAFQPLKKMAGWNGTQLMDHFFRSPILKTIFLGIVADFVTAPSEFPALGVPTIHLETAFDKRIPTFPGSRSAQIAYSFFLNGCQKMVDAMAQVITENGGVIITGTTITKILVEKGIVQGIECNHQQRENYDIVLASGGMNEVFFDLVGKDYLSEDFTRQIESNRMMESVLMVQIGIDFDPSKYQRAALCYYYETIDLEGAVHRLRTGDYHEGKEGLLIYVPSLHSPSMSPEGLHSVTVYTVAPDTLNEGTWASRREELAEKLLIEAEKHIPGLREHTRTRLVLTPEDFRKRTHQSHHCFGGVPPVMGNKPPAHETPIKGLWFIGAQSESGGGVVKVMAGAAKVAKKVLTTT
jgi:phytoene dehydrogenase-like protein